MLVKVIRPAPPRRVLAVKNKCNMNTKHQILRAKINLKGFDSSVPMSRLHDRIVRRDRKSGYSRRGLIALHKTLTRLYTQAAQAMTGLDPVELDHYIEAGLI